MTAETPSGPLQFDKVEVERPDATNKQAPPTIACASCSRTIRSHYFSVGGSSICDLCKRSLVNASIAAQGWPALIKALMFGLGASIAGAIVYYAVIAITDYEIGLVAILIGYMVGFAVRKATQGFGGRRYQVIAVALTYFAVGLAYVPLVLSQASQETKPTSTVSAAPATPETPATPQPAETPEPSEVSFTAEDSEPARWIGAGGAAKALVFLFLFSFALPAIAVFSTFPSGILSAIIIGVGLRQAWRMTAAAAIDVTGPYKLGQTQAT